MICATVVESVVHFCLIKSYEIYDVWYLKGNMIVEHTNSMIIIWLIEHTSLRF